MTSTESEVHRAKKAAQRERSLRTLAENAQWLDGHRAQSVQAAASAGQPDLMVKPKVDIVADAGQLQQ